MSDLLDRIQREIRERLAAGRAAVLEYERLERALHALADVGSRATHAVGRRGAAEQGAAGAPQGSSAPAAEPPARSPARRGATGASRSGGPRSARAAARGATARQRAPRGANREAVLRVIGERPGVSANELAAVSGVKGGTLYALLRTLAQRGEVEKRGLPGGQTGYQLAGGQAAGAPAPVGAEAPGDPAAPAQAAAEAPVESAAAEAEAESAAPAADSAADSAASASGDTPSGAGQPDEAAATAAEETDT